MDHRVDHTRCNIVALRDRGLGGSEPSGWNQTSPPMMNRAIRSAPPRQSFCYAMCWPLNMESWIFATVYSMHQYAMSIWVVSWGNAQHYHKCSLEAFFHSKASLIKRISLANCTCSRNGHVEQSIGTAVSTLACSWNKYHLTMLQFIPRPRPNNHLKFEYIWISNGQGIALWREKGSPNQINESPFSGDGLLALHQTCRKVDIVRETANFNHPSRPRSKPQRANKMSIGYGDTMWYSIAPMLRLLPRAFVISGSSLMYILPAPHKPICKWRFMPNCL